MQELVRRLLSNPDVDPPDSSISTKPAQERSDDKVDRKLIILNNLNDKRSKAGSGIVFAVAFISLRRLSKEIKMNFTNTKRWSTGILAAFAAFSMLTAAAPVEAVATLTFDQLDNAGTVSYDGAGGALIGTNIKFETIVSSGTPLNSGIINGIGCLLNFTTGLNTSDTGGSYTWAGGGTFTITGGFAPAGLGSSAILVSGIFSQANAILSGGSLLVTSLGTDTKHQGLIDYFFGVGAIVTNWNFVESTINATGVTSSGGTAFSASLGVVGDLNQNFGNADFVNTAPVPGSVSLLLLGLSALAAFRRRIS
jgi:hypothetical protein